MQKNLYLEIKHLNARTLEWEKTMSTHCVWMEIFDYGAGRMERNVLQIVNNYEIY